ncbi:MAG: type IV pilus twitching motility protein PilT [Lachnospiraceae bacterium]|nr:type IV pilus twitching motility protein PilT [Lachnospiraceae bacterium]
MAEIDKLLLTARDRGASDVHLTAMLPPMARINGELVPLTEEKLTVPVLEELIRPILNETMSERLDTEGQADFSYAIPHEGRFRANVFRQRGSLAAVLRLVGTEIPPAEKLGIPAEVMELVTRQRGLVLVTGPTGSGKSTTLASMIARMNRDRNCHIITLEDPIEYLHNHGSAIINQREIGTDTVSYAAALRAALREDPDVILVGEMRDLDTISTAITAAETGHLVLSTLHTTGAAATIDRIIDVFPEAQQQQIRLQLSNVLEAVISQLLLPKADGKGRVAAFEVMFGSVAICNLIREKKTHQINGLIQTSKKLGMKLMDDDLYDLYMNEKISRETILSSAQDIEAMQKRLVYSSERSRF